MLLEKPFIFTHGCWRNANQAALKGSLTQPCLARVLKSENICRTTKQIPLYASFVCTLQVRFLLSPRFQSFRSLFDLFQPITKHCSAGAKLFCIWNFISAAFFGIRESPSRALWILIWYSSDIYIIQMILRFFAISMVFQDFHFSYKELRHILPETSNVLPRSLVNYY